MNNIYFKNPENKWDTQWFLLEGGIFESFRYDTFKSFNDKVWLLIVALTSRRKKSVEEKQQLISTLENLILMVKGCHYFLHHKKRLNFKEEWIDIKWRKNPYRCIKKYRSEEDKKRNHHLAYFQEPLSRLSRAEAQNFTIAFKNFFAEMDLSSWLSLLDDWKSCLQDDENVFDLMVDNAPLKTYEKLITLYEACIVSYHWAEFDYPPPNHHLIMDYLSWGFENGYAGANPFDIIGNIFYEKNYLDIRRSILELYALYPDKKKGLIIEANDLRFTLTMLLETAWLLLQTDYFPENWLNPDSFHMLYCPIPEAELKHHWTPQSLSYRERENLRKTLSRLYCGIDVRQETYDVEGRIISYNDSNLVKEIHEKDLKTRNRLLKTLDILTLIVLDFRK
ncbi:hypothetical protein ACG2LH_05620 [Zhouia sp. PK063]|uniref:hypothetical protein n=1 Tax=Zhouia sp. PK063 TaxID=3373602 RepID=UPI0037AF2DDD